jgi:hypothetical protein
MESCQSTSAGMASARPEDGMTLRDLIERWRSPALTDIHDRAAKPRKDVQNGDHGREAEAATAVVLR